jgi:hypothetical protein
MYAEKSARIFREKYTSLVLTAAGVSLTCDKPIFSACLKDFGILKDFLFNYSKGSLAHLEDFKYD